MDEQDQLTQQLRAIINKASRSLAAAQQLARAGNANQITAQQNIQTAETVLQTIVAYLAQEGFLPQE